MMTVVTMDTEPYARGLEKTAEGETRVNQKDEKSGHGDTTGEAF